MANLKRPSFNFSGSVELVTPQNGHGTQYRIRVEFSSIEELSKVISWAEDNGFSSPLQPEFNIIDALQLYQTEETPSQFCPVHGPEKRAKSMHYKGWYCKGKSGGKFCKWVYKI